jgi:hypothetical protein
MAAVVIGESPRRDGTLTDFKAILSSIGFDIQDSILRNVPRQRTMSPQLNHEEIILLKLKVG